jgi:uncharacterized protein YwqG
MKFITGRFKSIFSLETVEYLSLFILILTVPGVIALVVKLPVAIYEAKTSFHIEGYVESISFSQATIKGLYKPVILDFDCNCEISKSQLQNTKYLSAKVVEDEESYTALVLVLDGKNLYDNIDVKGHFIGLMVFVFIALVCLGINRLISRKASHEIEKHWNKTQGLIDTVRLKADELRKPSLRLLKTSNETISYFGGRPLVQEGFIWPESNNKPMTFLAQIDLSEMSAKFKFDWLPEKGLLLFFYDTFEMHWGFDPKHRSGWKVIYQSCPGRISELPQDIDKKHLIKKFCMHPEKVDLLPTFDDIYLEDLGFDDDEIDAYIEISSESGDLPKHQLGGFPSPIQNGMMNIQAQLVSNGIYLGKEVIYTEEIGKIEEDADDWRLLFQFDSDDELGSMWCDAGKLYFWVQASKSIHGKFDDCWVFLQSH